MLAPLPDKYYLTHARELFSFLERHCDHLLGPQHQQYLHRFKSLSDDGQCLLVRMLARKPRFIRRDSLDYAEIDDLDSAVIELTNNHYVNTVTVDDWCEFSPHLTKAELLACLEPTPIQVKKSTSKAELVSIVKQTLRGDEPSLFAIRDTWLARCQQTNVDYLLFLYFGDLSNRLQKFAMRDLGVLKTRQRSTTTVARFSSIEQAEHAFKLHQLRRDYHVNPEQVREQAIDYLQANALSETVASIEKVKDKLLLQVAHDLVKNDRQRAIELWQQSDHPTALEKWVRTRYQNEDRELLRSELEHLKKTSLSAEKKLFIEDFYQRKFEGKRTSVYTDMLREAGRELSIVECYLGDVEEGVLQRYRQLGNQAWFTENKLWHVIFSFSLWPILFDGKEAQHTEFDFTPIALRDPEFYRNNQSKIEQQLSILNQPELAIKSFTRLAANQYGSPTGLFRWSATLLDSVIPCLQHAPPNALANVVREMARNYEQSKSGYPDLMVLDQPGLRFEEVKAPGDVLRPNQLLAIERLRKAGVAVDICQVTWATDPNQIYAVVDIETTGGKRGGNAITEIAVVRVKNQSVISEWSTLVNPGRPIPAHITRLTGINNQMVATAPNFGEVAAELEQQLDGAVFVAHNVGFDYGFIKAAFDDLGRKFKKPKYCTVQHARKAFPGLRSYSLGNLTASLDIDLKNAHRALDDARATAHLLTLIQAELL